MVDMTLMPLNKVKVIHFGTNRFLVYDFLYAVNSNFCSRTYRLATILHVTDDGDGRQTDAVNTVRTNSATVRTVCKKMMFYIFVRSNIDFLPRDAL